MFTANIDDGFFERIKRDAENGDANVQAILGVCYFTGYEVEQNKKLGIEWLKKSMENGGELGHWFWWALGVSYE